YHESGRSACNSIDLNSEADIDRLSPQARMDALVTRTLQPGVEALAATGEINSKLIWSNTGSLINWYLGEMRALLGDERLA
ncbi:IucA/IucC family C-terminal-domain containing protein, partial [Klebsiella pneumoniae]|uniref:IucA/IucC family C-terminal-domain containing protein n=1 Tax=Klebsiella pneumoniae TaxID=573 RepID=UPI0027314870